MHIDYGLLNQALYVVTEKDPDALLAMPASRLAAPEGMQTFLNEYMPIIKGRDLQVAAAYFASSWRTMLTAHMYFMTACEGSPDLSLQNLTLEIRMANQYPCIFFVLGCLDVHAWPAVRDEAWRQETAGHWLETTLRPLMEMAAEVSGVPVRQLWGQMPLGVEFYLDYLGKMTGEPVLQERMAEQKGFLAKELSASWFGLSRNPFDLKAVWLEDPYRPSQKTRMKPTCCLAYRTDTGHGYCYGCPKLSKTERAAKYEEIVKAQAIL